MQQPKTQKEIFYCIAIGKTIRRLRLTAGKSLNKLANENEISRSTLSRIENGECTAQIISLQKIAESMGLDISKLFEQVKKELPENWTIFEDDHL